MTENLTPKLVQAFTETDYIVHHEPPFTMNIGKPCEELKKLMAKRKALGAAFITAWNPLSQKLSAKQNDARQQELKEILKKRGLTFIDGIGQHPSNKWHGEASVLVLDLNLEAAKVLANHFEQHAFVWTDKTAVPKLVLP
jgi:hypothetical protein